MNEKDNYQEEEKKKEESKGKCHFCNRIFIFSNLNKFSNCIHYICNFCLFERIFSIYIIELQGQNQLEVSCRCEKSTLKLTMTELLDILIQKRTLDLTKVIESGFENIEKTVEGCECSKEKKTDKALFSDYFCLDCLKWICSRCRFQKINDHYKHRVLKSRYLIQYLKKNIENVYLKSKNSEIFEKNMEQKANQFQEIISNQFSTTIGKLNELIKSAIQLKEDYIKKYKGQMADIIRTFKIIKICYLYYYTDKASELKKKNAENNDIFKLKYLANLSYDFRDFTLEHYDIDTEIEKIKKEIGILCKKNNLIKSNFNFEKIENIYILDEIYDAHNKFITGLIKINNKIITSSLDYDLKIWENETGTYKLKKVLRKGIVFLLGLKNGKIFASGLNSKDIFIYEVNSEGDYYISQSLSNHDDAISSIIELEDGKVVSGSKDQKIIIWEENQKSKQYIEFQQIGKEKPIKSLMALPNFQFAYIYQEDNAQIRIMGANYELNEKLGLTSKKYTDLYQLKVHKGRVNCLCLLNNGYIVSGGGDEKNVIDHDLYLWKFFEQKYTISQCVLNAHESDINCVIQLRDGNIASSSKDRSIKIWKLINNMENTISLILKENLNHYKHGLYKLIQIDDDRIVVVSSDNKLVFWKNTSSII